TVLEPGWPKHRLLPETLYDMPIAWDCAPAVLVFPRVADGLESHAEPMSRDAALVELLSNVPLTDRTSSQAHLDALAELVRASECLRLFTGRDFEAIPTFVREFIEGARRRRDPVAAVPAGSVGPRVLRS
ncbi:MAG: hypothetical protein M3025_04215, partial [Actinomycetota bacterium]|nr:hypothetical protein [Actinomycetota bacterium]